MKTRKISLTTKMVACIVFSVLVIAIVMGGVSYMSISSELTNRILEENLTIAKAVAANIDGDVFEEVKKKGSESEEFSQIFDELSVFFQSDYIKYIYTMDKKDEQTFTYIVDADTQEPAEFGEEYEAEEQMLAAYDGTPTVLDEPSTDEWGVVYSAYAPIHNSKGSVVGIVGVDCGASQISKSINALLVKLLVIAAGCVAIFIILALLLGRRLRKGFRRVNEALVAVGSDDGDLTQRLNIHSGDELEVISNSLNDLLEKTRDTIDTASSGSKNVLGTMKDINTRMEESGNNIENINETMHNMVKASEDITQSILDAQSDVNDVYSNMKDMAGITENNTELVGEISSKSTKLSQVSKDAVEHISENISHMADKLGIEKEKAHEVDRINELTNVILDISSNTNLLALNASIEAARAGEAGRGFAVVAGEISTLAENTNNAVIEIRDVSSGVISAIDGLKEIADNMLEYLEKVVVSEYGQFNDSSIQFAESTRIIRENMMKSNAAAEKCFEDITKIRTAIESVSAASEENSAEIVNASENINAISSMLQEAVAVTGQTYETVGDMAENLQKYKV